uniref:HMG box domain-containing protein n=1 Tax=Kalmanozyma brasiliensis (strain GHG001) TaxID=1365824 RepID=V5EXW7_KALBG
MRELKGQKNNSAATDTGLDKLDHQRRLSKVIGELWRNEAADVKATFYEKAHQAAREHAERYPEYRFKPANVKKCLSQDVGPSTADHTPEKRENTDFSPGDISGPLSGSGSGNPDFFDAHCNLACA